MRAIILMIASLFALSACGNEKVKGLSLTSALTDRAKGVVTGAATPAAQAAAAAAAGITPAQALLRAQFAKLDVPIILAHIPSRDASANLSMIRQNGSVQTYLTADKITVNLDNDLLVSTRGLGADLMSTDNTGRLAAVRHGHSHAPHTLVLRHLDGQDRLAAITLSCQVTTKGPDAVTILGKTDKAQIHLETCASTGSDGTQFTNAFWMKDNQILRSLQWVSPNVGPIVIERVQ